MKILGIETSCDETAAAIVTDDRKILSNIVFSQFEEHAPYGGVVPEIASRSHIKHIGHVIELALSEANTKMSELDAIAATAGPGLIGGVIVGLMTAKGISSAIRKPLIAVNHLEGHALTVRLTDNISFPYLLLLVSGGHCQILAVDGVGKYTRLGTTLDDALGEAFDKTAKMLGLGYPGGPAVEKHAKKGNEKAYDLPQPMVGREGCDFSFSGLKTAVFRLVEAEKHHKRSFIDDICASFQHTCGEIVENRVKNAIRAFKKTHPEAKNLVIAGGVAANQYLHGRLEKLSKEHGMIVTAPPIKLCTDNAAMIAWAGLERLKLGLTDGLDTIPRARWPLDNAA